MRRFIPVSEREKPTTPNLPTAAAKRAAEELGNVTLQEVKKKSEIIIITTTPSKITR